MEEIQYQKKASTKFISFSIMDLMDVNTVMETVYNHCAFNCTICKFTETNSKRQ